jgi:hypothetical protein
MGIQKPVEFARPVWKIHRTTENRGGALAAGTSMLVLDGVPVANVEKSG